MQALGVFCILGGDVEDRALNLVDKASVIVRYVCLL